MELGGEASYVVGGKKRQARFSTSLTSTPGCATCKPELVAAVGPGLWLPPFPQRRQVVFGARMKAGTG